MNSRKIKQNKPQNQQQFDVKKYLKEGVTEEEILKLKDCFDSFDLDKSGYLDLFELKTAITELGMESSSDKLQELLQQFDADGDNQIDFSEFLEWMGAYNKRLTNEDVVDDLFNLVTKGNTTMTLEDLNRISNEIGERYTQDEIQEMFQCADVNQDNQIDFQEFANVITKEYK